MECLLYLWNAYYVRAVPNILPHLIFITSLRGSMINVLILQMKKPKCRQAK